MPADPSLRVLLFARALRISDGCGGLRHLCSVEVDLILAALRRRSAPLIGMSVMDSWLEDSDSALYIPLFERWGCWGFSSEHNAPSLLRVFWRAVLEMLFGVDVATDMPDSGHGHPLIFSTLDRRFELEVTDEWGDGWNVVVNCATSSAQSVGRRSRAGTPETFRGPVSWSFV